ncbi:WbqC family protein [Bernardetia sp. ABR2-2B]|uniref:WbqC family protein n=1 Tax=Bernardetia sp. ABR2-2B TaxID=3127472 RepID=UPI0030D1CC30
MKLAIMQPYIFPYIGYFQLINAVDKFVIYDDVNYINKGWINRNKILVNNNETLFTIPLQKASQNKKIREIEINYTQKGINKFIKTIQNSYSKAPNYSKVSTFIEDILLHKMYKNISELNTYSIKQICNYLNITTPIIDSSSIYENEELKAQYRILDICKKEKATVYINPIGGKEIYDKPLFEKQNIDLFFIKSEPVIYSQYKENFVPFLSIIDIMMFNSKETIQYFLSKYQLL